MNAGMCTENSKIYFDAGHYHMVMQKLNVYYTHGVVASLLSVCDYRDTKIPYAADLLHTLEQKERKEKLEEMNKKLLAKNEKKLRM